MKNENVFERETLLKFKLTNSKKKQDKNWKEKVMSLLNKKNESDKSQGGISNQTNTYGASTFNFRKFKFFIKSKNKCEIKPNGSKQSSIFSYDTKKSMEKFSLLEQSSSDDKAKIDKCVKDNFNKNSRSKNFKDDIRTFKKSVSSVNKVPINHLDNNKKNLKQTTKSNYNNSNSYNKSIKVHLIKSFEKNKAMTSYKDPKKNLNLTEKEALAKIKVEIGPKYISKKYTSNIDLNKKELANLNDSKNEDVDDGKLKNLSETSANENKLNDDKTYLNNIKNENFLLLKQKNMNMELKKKDSSNLEHNNFTINKTQQDANSINNLKVINNLKLKKINLIKRANEIIEKQTFTTDELLYPDNLKGLRRTNTKELMNMKVPFMINPPNMFCENAYNISPLPPIEEKIDIIQSILNNNKNEIVTLVKLCTNNSIQCSDMLKIILDALTEGEDSIVSKLNKNKLLQNEIVTELEKVLKSVSEE